MHTWQLLSAAGLVLACGYLDRLRGSDAYDLARGLNGIDTLLLGVAAGLLLGVPWLWLLPLAGLFLLGERPGWGEPLGALLHPERGMRAEALEWWQIGPLAHSAGMACLFRGLLWGLPCLLLLPWLPQVALLPPAMGAAFVLAPLIAGRWCDRTRNWAWPLPPTDKYIWDKMEAVRGWLFGGLLLLGRLLGG